MNSLFFDARLRDLNSFYFDKRLLTPQAFERLWASFFQLNFFLSHRKLINLIICKSLNFFYLKPRINDLNYLFI